MPSSPLMNDFWRDALSIGAAVLTLLGLVYAILQIRKTKSAADAARDASDRALAESRELFKRYALANSLRFLAEARIYVETSTWDRACLRVNDISHHVAQLASMDPGWGPYADRLSEWESTLRKHSQGTSRKFASAKWNEFLTGLQRKIDEHHDPLKHLDREVPHDLTSKSP